MQSNFVAAVCIALAAALPLHETLLQAKDFQRLVDGEAVVTSAAPLANFYGKIIDSNSPEATTNFSSITASGSSTFAPNSTDFANVYHSPDDYDTWRQSVPVGASTGTFSGTFNIQYANMSSNALCAVLEFAWSMTLVRDAAPEYRCSGRILALEFDCHTNWGVSTECTYDAGLNEVVGVWNVVNLGPDNGVPRSYVVHKHGDAPPSIAAF